MLLYKKLLLMTFGTTYVQYTEVTSLPSVHYKCQYNARYYHRCYGEDMLTSVGPPLPVTSFT